jgi:hypothetical protein
LSLLAGESPELQEADTREREKGEKSFVCLYFFWRSSILQDAYKFRTCSCGLEITAELRGHLFLVLPRCLRRAMHEGDYRITGTGENLLGLSRKSWTVNKVISGPGLQMAHSTTAVDPEAGDAVVVLMLRQRAWQSVAAGAAGL